MQRTLKGVLIRCNLGKFREGTKNWVLDLLILFVTHAKELATTDCTAADPAILLGFFFFFHSSTNQVPKNLSNLSKKKTTKASSKNVSTKSILQTQFSQVSLVCNDEVVFNTYIYIYIYKCREREKLMDILAPRREGCFVFT